MEKNIRWIRISELERLSGTPRRTIHFYVQNGLLHPPKKTGKTMAYYDEAHLKKLEFIHTEKQKGAALPAIREKITDMEANQIEPFGHQQFGSMNITQKYFSQKKKKIKKAKSKQNRKDILELGCRMFLQKGYRETKVSDITKTLDIGKGTFYFYFNDKKELLFECVPIIFESIFATGWDKIRQIKDPTERLQFRAEMVLPFLKEFCAIIQLSKEAIEDADPKIKQLGEQVYLSIRKPVESDIRKAIDNGIFKEMDPKIAATLMLGVMENVYYLQTIDKQIAAEKIWNKVMEIITFGVRAGDATPKI